MINLKNGYCIDADGACYMLKKSFMSRNKKTGEETESFKVLGYYTRLSQAFLAYSDALDMEIVKSRAMSLKDALKTILESRESVKREIRSAIPDVAEKR